MQLMIGSKNTSSWSMRAWIVMREKGIPFEEVSVPMRDPDASAQRLRATLPSGKVPCLVDGGVTVWETLAILEYLAETVPEAALWPAERPARAHARHLERDARGIPAAAPGLPDANHAALRCPPARRGSCIRRRPHHGPLE